ncbi:MAG: glycosyltransferase, partial [Acidimicrobiales bacterium]
MRLVIGGGGTAGHVFPGLALIEQWPSPGPQVWWMGCSGGMEEGLVRSREVEFLGVRAGAVRGKGPVKMASSCLQSLVGTAQALIALRRLRP